MALVAAGKELAKAGDYSTRHILLFSDAADSEEPGNYQELLEKFEKGGITVSVIGLGNQSDPDAELLKDIADRGKGNIMFSTDPQELPRLFAQDTLSVARNTFVKKNDETQPEGIPGAFQAGARLLGELGSGEPFPTAGGYNLCYLKPDATLAVASQDEYQAPWSAAWYRGLGRAAAITLEVDGEHSGAFGASAGYAEFLVTPGQLRTVCGRRECWCCHLETSGRNRSSHRCRGRGRTRSRLVSAWLAPAPIAHLFAVGTVPTASLSVDRS